MIKEKRVYFFKQHFDTHSDNNNQKPGQLSKMADRDQYRQRGQKRSGKSDGAVRNDKAIEKIEFNMVPIFSVHSGNLVVESKGDPNNHGDYIYHKLSVPSDVDFKTIQTKVIGDKLIVSADKTHTSPPPPLPQLSRTVASASPASSTSSSFRSSPTPRSFQQSVFDSKNMFPERNKLDSFGGLFADPYMGSFPTHGSNRTYDVTTNNDSTFVASVPLGREFIGHPEAVDISVNGQTVKLKVSGTIK